MCYETEEKAKERERKNHRTGEKDAVTREERRNFVFSASLSPSLSVGARPLQQFLNLIKFVFSLNERKNEHFSISVLDVLLNYLLSKLDGDFWVVNESSSLLSVPFTCSYIYFRFLFDVLIVVGIHSLNFARADNMEVREPNYALFSVSSSPVRSANAPPFSQSPYDSFMRKHLQHYGYFTGAKSSTTMFLRRRKRNAFGFPLQDEVKLWRNTVSFHQNRI